ncbi:MAG: hypothetical protein PHQ75_02730 [Thermoguttaceae bacterium]|nr:hypothetical protein [Thermoguttaceae bacterium]
MQQNTSPSLPVSDSRSGMMSVFDEQKPLSQYISGLPDEDTDSSHADSVCTAALQLQLQKLRPISSVNNQAKPVSVSGTPVARVEYPLYDGEEECESEPVPVVGKIVPEPDEIVQIPDETAETVSTVGPSPEDVLPEDVSPEDVLPEDVSPEDVSPEDVSPEDVSPEDVLPEDVSPEDVLPEDVLPEDVLPEDVLPEDVLPEDVSPEDVLPEDVLPEDVPNNIEPVEKEQQAEASVVHSVPEVALFENIPNDGAMISTSAPEAVIEPQMSVFPTDFSGLTTISFSGEYHIDTIIDYQCEQSTIHSFVDQEAETPEENEPGLPPVVQFSPEVDIISKDEVDDVCGRTQSILGEYPIFESFVSLVRQKRLVDSSFFFDPALDSACEPTYEPDEPRNSATYQNETDGLQDFCQTLSPRQQDSLLSFLKTLRTNNDAKRS